MSDHEELLTESNDAVGQFASVGALLRAEREQRGLSLVDVAQALKLTQRQVEAMENERFDMLPGAAFARGFLRNYARLLDLDPEPLLEALSQTSGIGAPELAPISNAQGTLPAGDGGLRPSALPVVVVAVLLLVAVVGGWYFDWFQGAEPADPNAAVVDTPVAPAPVTPVVVQPDPAPVVIPDDAPAGGEPVVVAPAPMVLSADQPVVAMEAAVSTPAANAAAAVARPTPAAPVVAAPAATVPAVAVPAVAVPAPAAETPAPVSDSKPAGDRLVFRFATESWVEVRDASGDIIFSRTNRAGSVQEVTGKPPYKLVVGNARNVKLEYRGEAVDLAPHTKVSVARLTLE